MVKISGGVKTDEGLRLMLHRTWEAAPTMSAPTKFKIGTGNTDPTFSDTDLETPILGWNAGADTKDFVSGYPQFDDTKFQVFVNIFVGAGEANGNLIFEVGCFNTDGFAVMDSRHTLRTGISKSDQDIIIGTLKSRLKRQT